jgi:hypothetical protein
MATTGSVDVNLTNFGSMVNASSDLGAKVVTGVADQGALIGLALGLGLALIFLFGIIVYMLRQITNLIRETKGIKKA